MHFLAYGLLFLAFLVSWSREMWLVCAARARAGRLRLGIWQTEAIPCCPSPHRGGSFPGGGVSWFAPHRSQPSDGTTISRARKQNRGPTANSDA